MSVKKEDMRIRKSKRDLRNSLIMLLKEKSFDNITVMDICNNAMINRVTFYRYYEDKIHLLDDTMKAFADTVIEKVPCNELITADDFCEYSSQLFESAINECLAHQDTIKALATQKNILIYNIIQTIIHSFLLDYLKVINAKHEFKFPIEIVSHFIEGGLTQSIYYWLSNRESYPKENLLAGVRDILNNIATTKILFK